MADKGRIMDWGWAFVHLSRDDTRTSGVAKRRRIRWLIRYEMGEASDILKFQERETPSDN